MKFSAIVSILLATGASALPTERFVNSTMAKTTAVKYAGVNIAGFDFGCNTLGSCDISGIDAPLTSLGGPDGAGQMSHFVAKDNLNIFRLPVGWQYLVGNQLGGNLNSANIANYDQLVQACLKTGATCIIDIHNYARWNGGVVGQGGPTNAQFVSLWKQLATKYKSTTKVAFGVMNEPHDLDINTWAATVQAVVTAIRGAGATTQMILLPGTSYTAAGAFTANGSGAALLKVTNPDGSTTNLIFDVHQYLDSDGSGTHTTCVTNNIASAYQSLAAWLRTNQRMAITTETGGGNTASCSTYLCQEISYMNSNSDVFLGYVGWAAGAFSTTYALSLTPTGTGSSMQDQSLMKTCISR